MANYFFTGALTFLVGILIGFLLSLRVQFRMGIRSAVKKHTDEAFGLIGYRAWVQTNPLFNPTICGISPSFCQIYTESSVAEKEGLLQVCGVGYGKALEFSN